MEILAQSLILIPLLAFLISFFIPKTNEKLLSNLTIFALGLHFTCAAALFVLWLTQGRPLLFIRYFTFYKSEDFEFYLSLFYDRISGIYLLLSSAVSIMVAAFSKYYLYREEGYKRYFGALIGFFTGLNFILLAGNFETLLIGWEALGITSFLLIAFYRDRYLPIKNALKVISLYRVSDASLLLAIWLFHHAFHEYANFSILSSIQNDMSLLDSRWDSALLIGFLLLVTASIKSGQFPFSYWLPRAMEGPTTSTAIFYGSISIHIGVFLLLRTYPYWSLLWPVQWAVVIIGIITFIISSGIARVQSTVKTQIAYSCTAQIGLIFVEVAMGWHTLALIHLCSNSLLRAYQLLVSPSVLSYKIHDQVFHFHANEPVLMSGGLADRLRASFYVLFVREGGMDSALKNILWDSGKFLGNLLSKLPSVLLMVILPVCYLPLLFFVHQKSYLSPAFLAPLPVLAISIAFMYVLRAFVERDDAQKAWFYLIMQHLFISLAIGFNDQFSNYLQIYIYLSGVVISAVIGYVIMQRLKRGEQKLDLSRFYGHAYEYPRQAYVFLIACLGFTGFPITPTFLGVDLLFLHIHTHQLALALLMILCFLLNGISIMRIFARLYCGPHVKTYHEVAYESS